MRTPAILRPERRAEKQFATIHLGDQRGTARAVTMGARLISIRNPTPSLPQQIKSVKAPKAVYHLLKEDDLPRSVVEGSAPP